MTNPNTMFAFNTQGEPSYSAEQITAAAEQVATVKEEIASIASAEAVSISLLADDESDLDMFLSADEGFIIPKEENPPAASTA
eukprot:8790277-Karenia_brevis.AAC.1